MRTKIVDLSMFDHENIQIKAWTFGQETAFIDEMQRIEKRTGTYPDTYASQKLLMICIDDERYNTKEAVNDLDAAVAGHLLLQIRKLLDPLAERIPNSSESPTKAEEVDERNSNLG